MAKNDVRVESGVEFEKCAAALVGHTKRGWKSEAAHLLDVSTQAFSAALRKGPGKPLAEKLRAALAGKKVSDVAEGMPADVGAWVAGEADTKSRDGSSECLVFHMSTPRLTLLARRAAGSSKTEFFVEFHSEASATRKEKLVELAKEKAASRLDDIARAEASREAVEGLLKDRVSEKFELGSEVFELKDKNSLALLEGLFKSREALARQKARLQEQLRQSRRVADAAAAKEETKTAFEEGQKYGELKAALVSATLQETALLSSVEQLTALTLLASRRVARIETRRGKLKEQKSEEQSDEVNVQTAEKKAKKKAAFEALQARQDMSSEVVEVELADGSKVKMRKTAFGLQRIEPQKQ